MMLKRRVREVWERAQQIDGYVWGFEAGTREEDRAARIKLAQPKYNHFFPLIDAGLTKPDCIKMVQDAGIGIPMMYRLGFSNNNCVGCVKGGMAYWNLIRKHFPDEFARMAALERKIGAKCLKKYWLDELPEDAGRGSPPLVQECGATGEGCASEQSRTYYARD